MMLQPSHWLLLKEATLFHSFAMDVQQAAILDLLLFLFSRNGCAIGGHLDSVVFHFALCCAIGSHVSL